MNFNFAIWPGLEACPLRKADLNVLDFVVNTFFIKLFRTNNIGMVKECVTWLLAEPRRQEERCVRAGENESPRRLSSAVSPV